MDHGVIRSRRLLFYTLYLAYVCSGIVSILPGPTLPLLAAHTAVHLDVAGWVFTASALGFAVGVFIAGLLMAKTGPKYILMGGLGLFAISSVITPVTRLFPVLLAAQFTEGIGFGFLDVSINIIITLVFSDTLGETLNNLHSSYGLGALIGPLVLSVVLQVLHSPLWAYLVGTAAGITCILLLIRQSVPSLPSRQNARQQHEHASTRQVLRQSLLWLLALQLFLYVGAEVGFSSWIVTAVSQSAAITLALAAPAATAFWFGLTSGRILGAQALKRGIVSERRLLYICATGGGLSGFVVAIFTGQITISFAACVVVGLFLGPLWPGIMAITSRWFIHALNTASSVLLISAGAAGMIVPVLVGLCITHVGINWGMAIPALASLAITVPLSIVIWRQRLTLRLSPGMHTIEGEITQANKS